MRKRQTNFNKWLVGFALLIVSIFGTALLFLSSARATVNDLPLITDFTSVKDSGCSGCSVAWNGTSNTLTATIAGGTDTKDTAYGLKDFGGSTGWTGMTYSRTILGFPAGQAAISQNLAVFQEYDINGNLIYELYVNGSDKTLSLWSPAGGLRTSSINTGSGVVVPTGSTIRVEIAALANNSITVRVNDTAKISLTGLSGATSKNPRYLRAGIDHYDATTTNEVVKMAHTNVGITTLGWLGTRTAPLNSPPVNTGAPTISGTTTVGQTLTAGNGTWSGSTPITYTYQWQRCDSAGANCANISGTTAQTYVLTSTDAGSTIKVNVTATNSAGNASALSAATTVVTGTAPTNTAAPTISGTATVGQILGVSNGSWSGSTPITYTYQWQRCNSGGTGCVDIAGATAATYTIITTDQGSTLKAVVTATNAYGNASASSAVSGIVGAAPANTGLPTVSGTAQDKQVLSATSGTWSGTTPITYTYQWQRCDSGGTGCVSISGATTQSYTLTSADVGSTTRVYVTATNSAGSAMAASAVTAVVSGVAPSSITAPAISGTVQVGQVLSVSNGSWSGSTPITYTYQWQSCSPTCSNIANATGSQYQVAATDLGNTLLAVVSATNQAGTSSAASSATTAVTSQPTPPVNLTLPVIQATSGDGDPLNIDGDSMSIIQGTWSGTFPITLSDQWQRCNSLGVNCTDILGATGSSYLLTSNDVGSTLVVKETAQNTAGSLSVFSTSTLVIQAAPPVNTALPIISGTAQQGQVLSASSGSWKGTAPINYAYQWQDCDASGNNCANISGATNSSYSLTAIDVNRTVRIQVSANNLAGTSTATSNQTTAVAAPPSSGVFGKTTVGSTGEAGGANYLDSSGPYNLAASATVYKLTGYVKTSGSTAGTARAVVYADNSGNPGALQAVSAQVTVPGGASAGWVDFPITTPVTLPAGNYWLGYWYGNGQVFVFEDTVANSERYTPSTYSATGNPQSPYGAASTSSSSYSLYASYTTASSNAPPANITLPQITGTTQQSQSLTANNGSWTNSPMFYTYQWQDCDLNAQNCQNATGAGNQNQSYTLTSNDVGHRIIVLVSATNIYGSSQPVSSAATQPVSGASGSTALSFVRHPLILAPYGQVTEGNNVGDINGDGKPDIIVAGDNYLAWYQNPDWTPHLVATGARYGAGAMVLVRDINGDGRNDIVVGEQSNPSCSSTCQTDWFENTGSGFIKHILSTAAYCHDIAFGDLNGDGRADMACADQHVGNVVWLQAPVDPTQPWILHQVDARSVMGAGIADINGDGQLDIVAGRAWYRNNGNGASWTRYPYTTLTSAAYPDFSDYEKFAIKDINGDGRLDIFATLFTDTPQGQAYAFLAPADPTQPWTPVQVDSGPLFSVHSTVSGTFDRTSDPEFAVGETNYGGWDFGPNPDAKVYIYRLTGADATNPSSWERTRIDAIGGHEMRAADLNGDGLDELVADFENTDLMSPPENGAVHWWENTYGATAIPPTSNGTLPVIYGTAARGQTLTVNDDIWSGTSPIFSTYQWRRCNSSGANCSNISGATGTSYTISSADSGFTISAMAAATNSAGSNSLSSNYTAIIP